MSDRTRCVRCLQPLFSCFCADIRVLNPKLKFAILIHPLEFKRRIATGRMAHLSLQDSELIVGENYTNHRRIHALVHDSRYQSMVLYPGVRSLNLSQCSQEHFGQTFPIDKIPLIFVIDGTWATARKTMFHSQNLKILPRISFSTDQPSRFQVRKQPAPECLSTIEAIHKVLELLSCEDRFGISEPERLLGVFHKMVAKQVEYRDRARAAAQPSRYRRCARRALNMKPVGLMNLFPDSIRQIET